LRLLSQAKKISFDFDFLCKATQRRKNSKNPKKSSGAEGLLCVFAILAPLREKIYVNAGT
jgi:hypothetical protein